MQISSPAKIVRIFIVGSRSKGIAIAYIKLICHVYIKSMNEDCE